MCPVQFSTSSSTLISRRKSHPSRSHCMTPHDKHIALSQLTGHLIHVGSRNCSACVTRVTSYVCHVESAPSKAVGRSSGHRQLSAKPLTSLDPAADAVGGPERSTAGRVSPARLWRPSTCAISIAAAREGGQPVSHRSSGWLRAQLQRLQDLFELEENHRVGRCHLRRERRSVWAHRSNPHKQPRAATLPDST